MKLKELLQMTDPVPELEKRIRFIGFFYGFLAVIAGAFGAHLLKERLVEAGLESAWNTGVYFLLAHAVLLVATGGSGYLLKNRLGRASLMLIWIGAGFFSFSIFALCLGAPSCFGPVTPVGGLALLVGWMLGLFAALTNE